MHIESSTFSPHRAGYDDFRVTRDAELLDRYAWTRSDADLAGRAEWVPLLHAVALPGGPVERETYDRIKGELIERLRRAGPLDGLVYDIHGAMSVVGLEDAEGDLTEAVREAIGPDALISAAMDPHGNVSRRFATAGSAHRPPSRPARGRLGDPRARRPQAGGAPRLRPGPPASRLGADPGAAAR